MSNTTPAAAPATSTPAASTTKVKAKVTKKTTTVATKPAATGIRPDLSKVRRGLKKAEAVAIVEAYKFPTEPFTLNQVFEATGIYHWYLVNYVKANAKIVGDAPKAPGVRGKAAKLYAMNFTR